MAVAFKPRSLYRKPHKVANGFLELLLLLPVGYHHERVDCPFPPLLVHGGMAAQAAASSAEPNESALKEQ